ncbi:MAG: C40 family peptidase [Spirochaetes bacterium]|nr:C40 family peptidase [Spirochaetota bacterium]
MRRFIPALFIILALGSLRAEPSEDELRKRIVAAALELRGVPYVYGAESPSAFDCSGFTRYVYSKVTGLSLPRSARGQFASGVPVAKDAAKPGDILVFDTVGGSPSHVGIYLGQGQVIHAASAGNKTGVIVSELAESYYATRFIAARSYLASPGSKAVEAAEPARPGATPLPAEAGSATPPATPAGPPPATPGVAHPAAGAVDEAPLAQIGFDVTDKPSVYADKIPAATGTRIAFTITNRSSADATFEILFYKANVDFRKTVTLRRERTAIARGASREIESYLFTEPGLYRLIVKSADNDQLVERTFKVVEAGK